MAYTLAQFITAAQAGSAIQIRNALDTPGARAQVILEIGHMNVALNPRHSTRAVDGTLNIGAITISSADNHILDLGTEFTAAQVLESRSLRRAISDGTVIAEDGLIELSRVSVINRSSSSSFSSSSSSSHSSSSSCSCSCSSCSCSSCSCSSSSCSSSSCSCSSCSCSSSSCSSSSESFSSCSSSSSSG